MKIGVFPGDWNAQMVGPEGIPPVLIYNGFLQKVRDLAGVDIITLFVCIPHPVLTLFERK